MPRGKGRANEVAKDVSKLMGFFDDWGPRGV